MTAVSTMTLAFRFCLPGVPLEWLGLDSVRLGEAQRLRTASISLGNFRPGGPPRASSHWEALRKYSSPGGNGAESMRKVTIGRRLELARSTSRNTCGESIAACDKMRTNAGHWVMD